MCSSDLFGLGIQGGGPLVHVTEPGDRPGGEEEMLGERRLAGPGMAGEDDRPLPGKSVVGHLGTSGIPAGAQASGVDLGVVRAVSCATPRII